jgi:hypothetical protein
VGTVSLVLLVLGIALVVYGVVRAREPYRRYAALREQDANIARYEAWRGGVRSNDKTGASVAMAILRRQWQVGVGIAVVGVVVAVAGVVVR